MDPASLNGKRILKCADEMRPLLESIALDIWRNPETAYNERRTSSVLKDFLSHEGFEVESKLAGLSTAFHARKSCRKSKPAVGFLSEMDALPFIGHACGHNIIGTAGAGAAACLRRALPRLAGSVEVFGCPAEESGGGKVRLARKGVFDHLDAALIVHPDTKTKVFHSSLALIEVNLRFFGKAAHAAAEPEKGINALYALIDTFNEVRSFVSEHPDQRGMIHGIVKDGGVAANIVPETASAIFYVRGRTMDDAGKLCRKLGAFARRSAKSSGARVQVHAKKKEAYEPLVPNKALGREFEKNLSSIGETLEKKQDTGGLGSTDVGNVSCRVPTISPSMKIEGLTEPCHSPGFADATASGQGMDMMMRAVKAMALTAAQVLADAALRRMMRLDFKRDVRGG